MRAEGCGRWRREAWWGRPIVRFVEQDVSLARVACAVAGVALVRMLLEQLLEHGHRFFQPRDSYEDLLYYLHFFASWCFIYLSMTFPVRACLGLRYRQALLFTLLFLPVIWTVPVVDFLATGGQGSHLVYIPRLSLFPEYFLRMLDPFHPLALVTPGVRCEIFAVTAGSFLLSLLHFRRGVCRSALLAGSIYLLIFFLGFLPPLVGALGVDLGRAATGVLPAQRYPLVYVWLLLAVGGIAGTLLWREDRARVRAAALFLYPSRSAHYLMLLGLGWGFGALQGGLYGSLRTAADLSKLAAAGLAVLLLFVHAKIANDLHDREIDRVASPGRPLVSGALAPAAAGSLAAFAWGAGLLFACIAAKSVVAPWLALWAAAHLYSVPPFRLRRFYPAGHLMLAAIATLVFLTGAMLALGDDAYVRIAAKEVFLYVFLAAFCLYHLKDFKDLAGDAAAGIRTLLHRTARPRLVGVGAVLGYGLALGLIGRRLGLPLWPAAALFAVAGGAYILRVPQLARIDRLFPASLLLLGSVLAATGVTYGLP